jgi:hypothetical protein
MNYAAREAAAQRSAETATDPELAAAYRQVAESYAVLARLMPSASADT